MVNASFLVSTSQDQFKSIVLEWDFPEEKYQTGGGGMGGLRTYFFWKKRMELFRFFSVSLEISKRKFHPRKFGKVIYVTSLRNFKAKNQRRPLETLHEFFLVSIGYFLLFLINSWKFCMLFLEHPWKFHILNHLSTCLDFFQNSPIPKTLCQFKRCPIRMKITYHQLLVSFFYKLILFNAERWA